MTPGLYAPSRASTSRARGSRCGPFIVADAVVEHEDEILFLALMIPPGGHVVQVRERVEVRSDAG